MTTHRGGDESFDSPGREGVESFGSTRHRGAEALEGAVEQRHRLEEDVRDLIEGFVAKDSTGRLRNVKMLTLLATAIDQIDYSILILDLNFHIVFANASTTRTSEYSLEEIVGASPRLFGSGWHSEDFYDGYEEVVRSGLPWHGVFINRRKSGAIYQEDVTISPIFDEGGSIIAYMEIKQELVDARNVQGELELVKSDQQAVARIMRDVTPSDDLRATAQSFCDEVVRLADIDVAVLLHPFGGSKMRTVAVAGTSVYDPNKIEPFVDRVPFSVLERVAEGPMRMSMNRGEWPGTEQFQQLLIDDGAVWVVATPIRFGAKMIGALICASRDPATEKSVDSRLVFFDKLGSFVGALIGFRSEKFDLDADMHAYVKDVIDSNRFASVFQPIVDFATSQPVGYEALTRFEDGVDPAQRFADAHAVDLGSELECATAAAALRSAGSLPENVFLCLNFSVAAILDGSAAETVRGAKRQIVIEITEHDLAVDYPAIKKAISAMAGCQLSIDDMGAGYTSLTKVVELEPSFLKLDISLIRNVDTNPTRQALVESMCHFAARVGVRVIAEGVESEAEAEMIKSLGCSMRSGQLLAQGYFYGVPMSARRE
ncbi:MAG: EAL domain-containing protein [Acidimicrobiales bacterium]